MFGSKPTTFGFGDTSNFGTSTPFGQSFGTPAFGSQNTATGGLFGSPATTTSGGLFGTQPTFGQPSSAFSFSNTPSTSGGLFGQQQTQGNSLFSQPANNAFAKTTISSFGSFGANNQNSSLFVRNQPTGTIFGQTNTMFSGSTGTGTTTKFQAPVGQDTMVKGGSTNTISTRHQCISAMKDYEDKSLEELRLEDYVAGHKGKQQQQQQLVQPQQQPAAPSTSLFGTPTSQATAGLGFGFGQNKSTGFGNTTGFGNARTNTSIFGQPRAPLTSSGLFGQPSKPLFANPSDSSSFTFGTTANTNTLFGANQQQQQQQQNKGLFGTTTSQANLFGTTNTATFGTSTTGFGANSTTPGLFGSKTMNFNTPSTNSFSFGQNSGNSLFTKPQTSTPFSFGTSTTTPGFGANTGTGLFNKTFNTNTALGNNSSTFNFNPTNTSNLFGNQKSFGAFNLNSAANSSFGPNLGTGANNMFNLGGNTSTLGSNTMSLSGATSDFANIQQHLKLLTHNPYGDSSLFMNLTDSKVKTEDILKPTNPIAQKAVLQYKVSARPMTKVKPKSLLPLISGKKTQMFDGLDDEDDFGFNSNDFIPKKNIKKLVIKNTGSTSKVPDDKGPMVNNNNNNNDGSFQSPSCSETFAINNGKDEQQNFVELFNDCTTPVKSMKMPSRTVGCSTDETQDTSQKPDGESEGPPVAETPHPANIVLTRPGYYTLPSLDELADLVDENGNCFINDFTIGREGYGSVFFPGTTNIAGINFDEIVHFRKKEVIVYPDDSKKPDVGLGLNKKAEITLDCVWPIDKTSRSPIKSAERLHMMKYEEKLESTTARIGGTFLDYRPETGSWVFEVKHFSKYGMQDDSDDEEIIANEKKFKLLQQQNLSAQKQKLPTANSTGSHSKEVGNEHSSDSKQSEMTNGDENLKPSSEIIQSRDELTTEDDAEMPDIFSQDYTEVFNVSQNKTDLGSESLSHSLAVGLEVNSSNMQMMKASFFAAESDELMETDLEKRMEMKRNEGSHMLQLLNKSTRTSLSTPGKSVKHCRLTTETTFDKLKRPHSDVIQILRVQPKNTYPKVVGMRIKRPIPNIKDSCMYKVKSLVDASFFMGHSFRVGWGPNWTFVHSGMSVGNATNPTLEKFSILTRNEKKVSNTDWKVNLEKLNVSHFLTSKNPAVINQHKWMLENQLDHSYSTIENDCPYFSPATGTKSLNIYAAMAEQDVENMISLPDYEQVHHMRTCWDICVALWGNPIELHSQANDKTSYEYHQMRREAISRWISETEANAINSEIEKNSYQVNGHLKNIMSYLSGRQVPEACAAAQKADDDYLALLLAQAGGVNKFCKQHIEQQLDNFNKYGVGEFIAPERLKILSLLAGKMVLKVGKQTINVCEDMNWRRALGLHLWYQCEPTSLIIEAVQKYDDAQNGNNFHGKYAKPPVPGYLENEQPDDDLEEPSKIYDTCYHLLKLYANNAYSLEQTLSPTTSTVNHLDYRLSWHLSQVLKSLGYQHLSLYQKECIHISFAAQLESLGLWHWAIFVLAHIEDAKRREAAIKDCLGRHICISTNEDYLACEHFIQNRLCIPPKWVHHAKAIKAGYLVMPAEEAWHLLKSHNWNKAHKVILRSLAADAIINDNHSYLEKYLLELTPTERNSTILDWSTGGAVYLNYINLCRTLQEIKKQEATISQLEKLWPEVTNLSSKIAHLPSRNPKDRLCQSEMSKKTANILRTLLMLKAQNDNSEITSILASHICNLEMPEDYMMQDFQALIQCYRQELCEEICS